MLKHVLVPLDGSALAEAALEYAQEIVDPEGQITLVTAVELDDLPAYGPSMMPLVRTSIPDYQDAVDNLMPQANAYLQRVADRLQMRGREVTYEVRIGHPAEVIVDVAREQNVDAIVISTHGRSGLGRWLFGSVTTKVLELARRPVFVVPSACVRVENLPAQAVEKR
ncbi:MAG: universal stress protein [Chloroflexota bacterium]|nr:MAG: universal stress protein [Chloroflexota bacterium]